MPTKLSYLEETDLATVMYANRVVIASAYAAGLPRLVERKAAKKIDAILAIGAVLDSDLKLCPAFRDVLDKILDRRSPDGMTFEDCRRIAIRLDDWHNEPFRHDWNVVVYRSR